MPGIRDWWRLFPPSPIPPGLRFHAMVYDPLRDKVILFGGLSGTTALDETWEYDPIANKWTNRAPAQRPPARHGHAMVYDSARGKVILFGGYPFNDETWEYDPIANVWTNRAPASAPSARYRHAMVYDSARGKVILFGGYPSNDETWEYDPVANQWTNRAPAQRPPARYGHAMVYDSARGKVILFGGTETVSFADTWEYDPVANTWTNRAPSRMPASRTGHAMVYDSARAKVMLVGGTGGSRQTWEYDPVANQWTNLTPGQEQTPPAMIDYAMVYDSARGRLITFGGQNTPDQMWALWTRRGLIFATPQGQPIDHHFFGTLMANEPTDPVPLDLWNGTDATVTGAQVSPSQVPTGDTVELSRSADPFTPETPPLAFVGTFGPGVKIGSLYVRLRPGASAGDRQFVLTASAEAA